MTVDHLDSFNYWTEQLFLHCKHYPDQISHRHRHLYSTSLGILHRCLCFHHLRQDTLHLPPLPPPLLPLRPRSPLGRPHSLHRKTLSRNSHSQRLIHFTDNFEQLKLHIILVCSINCPLGKIKTRFLQS